MKKKDLESERGRATKNCCIKGPHPTEKEGEREKWFKKKRSNKELPSCFSRKDERRRVKKGEGRRGL